MKLNKKGFTLIELIIAIVLMLSLTILVVVGFTKISDEKKKEADKLTEKQIITAAEQFFSSNYFYVKDMKEVEGTITFINLAKLVQEDYLNVVTKTSTETKYNMCDIVYASYSNEAVSLNYMPFEDVFKAENASKLGYLEDSGFSYNEYLKLIGLEDNVDKKTCTAEIFTASDIAVDIKIDEEYLKNNKITLNSAEVNNINWYDKNIPLLITVINIKGEKNPKNRINSINLSINDEKIEYEELSGSSIYEKKFRVFAQYNNINKVKVFATTAGGKKADKVQTYYIDKEAPLIQMVAYKTNDINITNNISKISNIPSADIIESDTWVNSSGKKNIYLYIQVTDQYSGINLSKFKCNRISGSGADANKDNLSADRKTYNKLYFYKNDKISTYECEGFDYVGNSSGKKIFTIKRDVTNPNINLLGYYGDSNTIGSITFNNLNNTIKKLNSYKSGGWTNQAVALKVERGDNLSGIKSHNCIGLNSSFKEWNRVYGRDEGTFDFSCSIEDNAGNINSTSFVVKRDITNPTVNVTINKCDYNSSTKQYTNCSAYSNDSWSNKNVYTNMTSSDSGSGVKISCYAAWGETTNADCESTKAYTTTLSRGIRAEGVSYIGYAACDNAGNCKTINNGSPTYIVKLDHTNPTCSVQTKGNVKTVTYSNYRYNVSTEEKTNQTVWYSDSSINVSLSSYSDALSGLAGYGLTTSSWKTYNSSASSIQTAETDGTTWYGYVKDNAGNENNCSRSLKNDYTAPTVVYDAGPVECKGKDGSKHSWGFSFKFSDNLSKTNLRMTQYYSAASCKNFNWHDNNNYKNSTGPAETVYSVFSRCDRNPAPAMRFVLKDEAGNVYNSGNAKQVNANGKENKDTSSCDTSVFYSFD